MCDKQLLIKAFSPLVSEFFHGLTVDEHFDWACLVCATAAGSVQHLVVFDYFLHQQFNFL